MKNLLLKIEYRGSSYKGWQRQPEVSTVEDTIETAIEQICQCPIAVNGCSRTDAGVHALGQVATVIVPDAVQLRRFFHSLNAILPKDISIVDMVQVPPEFSVRKKNVGKRYTYQISNSPIQKALHREYYWWIKKPLDLIRMQKASKILLGAHDFSAFRGSGCQQRFTEKTIHKIDFTIEDGPVYTIVRIHIEGSGFLKNMIRVIVGTLVDIAKGHFDENVIVKAFRSKLREDLGSTAPACGLILDEIFFQPDPFKIYRSDSWNSE